MTRTYAAYIPLWRYMVTTHTIRADMQQFRDTLLRVQTAHELLPTKSYGDRQEEADDEAGVSREEAPPARERARWPAVRELFPARETSPLREHSREPSREPF